MFVYALHNIYVESCIPILDAHVGETSVNYKIDMDRYLFESRYCGGGSKVPVGDLILQILCADFVTCFPFRSMKCGWKRTAQIDALYRRLGRLLKQ